MASNIKFEEWKRMIEETIKKKKIHNRKYKQGYFIPKNPEKCINVMETNQPIVYRSGWEAQFCDWLDKTTAVISWGSECLKILYPNPLTGKMSFYFPDFYIIYIDSQGKLHKELIEIKPMNQSRLNETHNAKDKLEYVKNLKKWEAALHFCEKRDIKFRVLTQYELFGHR